MRITYRVDISNLLDRWFFFTDADKFTEFFRQGMKNNTSIPEIVATWNAYATSPKQHVWLQEIKP